MDDHALLGLELIERDESGNITAVITEGLGGGQVNVVVSFRISVEEEEEEEDHHHTLLRHRNCIEALAADRKGRYRRIRCLTLREFSVFFYQRASRQA